MPPEQQGITILGTPLGHVEFVKARVKAEEHEVLLNRGHMPSGRCSTVCWTSAHKTVSTSQAFRVGWEGWASDMIRKRNPDVADFITVLLSRRGGPHVEVAARCREGLLGVGFDAPDGEIWFVEPDQTMTRWWTLSQAPADGWQEKAFDAVEHEFLVANVWSPNKLSSFPARSHGGTSKFCHCFRSLGCGRPLDSRAACPLAGVLGAPRIFVGERSRSGSREAGSRVTTNKRSSPGCGPPPPASSRQPQTGGCR